MRKEVIDGALSVHQPAFPVLAGNDVRLLHKLLRGHVAHQCVEYVLQGNDALEPAEFVADKRPVNPLRLHVFKHGVYAHILVDIVRLLHHLLEIQMIVLAQSRHVILDGKNADHVVDIAVHNRILLEYGALNGLDDLILGHFEVQPYDIVTQCHDGADAQVTQCEHALHYILFHRRHLSLILAFLDYGLDLILSHLGLPFLDT